MGNGCQTFYFCTSYKSHNTVLLLLLQSVNFLTGFLKNYYFLYRCILFLILLCRSKFPSGIVILPLTYLVVVVWWWLILSALVTQGNKVMKNGGLSLILAFPPLSVSAHFTLCWGRIQRFTTSVVQRSHYKGPRKLFAIFNGKQMVVTNYNDYVLCIWICHTFLYSKTPTA